MTVSIGISCFIYWRGVVLGRSGENGSGFASLRCNSLLSIMAALVVLLVAPEN